ncbi:hypothetical protein [Pseudomonas sp. URIL14HWK12:I5]|uniref:MuF-C-terminal domain-containing protein n=1 Tax=Pseudomonas sp. URIL14HWK12:I5 TaxID=1261630 RepID=UPI0009D90D3C|nr:hypothetical protein [Pseudomonas sp. URIL14HWK12:I5]SMD13864.1 hypothetical protein SAMN05660385_04728 [Pseudomonas sp. URIL14HWK12:I5]
MSTEGNDLNFKTLVGVVIQAEVDEKPRHELILELGPTPAQILQSVGQNFQGLDLIIKGKTIGKMHFDHGVSKGVIERLPDILQSPKAIYQSATGPDGIVVMTFEIQRGYPLIIPIHANKRVGRDRSCNVIASMYAKEGPDPQEKWEKAGLLLWKS